MEKSRGETWVRRVGRHAIKTGKAWPILWIFFAVFQAGMGVLSWGLLGAGIGAAQVVLSVLCLGVAFTWFERRHFYLIIEQQEARIAQLERQLRQEAQPGFGIESGPPAPEAQWQPQP